MSIILLLLTIVIVYILWTKIGYMYYTYWIYKRRGVPVVGFPLPLLGNVLMVKKSLDVKDKYKTEELT